MLILTYANALILAGAALVLAGIVTSLAARRFGAPLLLVFLLMGMAAGPGGLGLIRMGDPFLTYLVGTVALAIILFDGGLSTKVRRLRGALLPATLLATVGVVVTAGLTALAAIPLFGLPPLEAFLLGAIVASTDAAAVFFLLRTGGLQLRPRVGAVLEFESGTNDPVAVFIVLIVTEYLVAPTGLGAGDIAFHLAEHAVIGALAGIAGGFALVLALNRLDLPGGLQPIFALAATLVVFGATAVSGGSGFIAVYLMGLIVANRPVRAFPTLARFTDGATWLAQIAMFLVLGLLVSPANLPGVALAALGLTAFLTLIGRPAAVALCLKPFGFSWRETGFVAWVGLRGAVSIFLAAVPLLAGAPQAQLMFDVAFVVVLSSLLVQGWTIAPSARLFGMALSRVTPDVHRVEIDLPGQTDQELAGYPVTPEAAILKMPGLPDWARLVLVARAGQVLDAREATDLKPGDYAYVLAPPKRVARLDRLFAPDDTAKPVFGDLALRPETLMKELVALYPITIAPEEADKTLEAFIIGRLIDDPEVHDRVELGPIVLVVAALKNDRISRVSLHLADLDAADPDAPRLTRRQAALAWLKARIHLG
jgi:potassium/hydrogen antiporter